MDGWHPHVPSPLASAASVVERTTVYLDAGQRRRLRALAAHNSQPPAHLIAEAIDRYLDRQPEYRVPSWVGAWTAGPRTDAATVKRPAPDQR